MNIVLKDHSSAYVTYYTEFRRILFTGIDKSITVEPGIYLSVDVLNNLYIALKG